VYGILIESTRSNNDITLHLSKKTQQLNDKKSKKIM